MTELITTDVYLAHWRSKYFQCRDTVRAKYHRKFKNDFKCVSGFVRPASIVLDIGSNHGRFAIEAALVHGGQCDVFSFEPSYYNIAVQKKVIAAYPNIQLLPFGLSDGSYQMDILTPVRGNGSLCHGDTYVEVAGNPAKVKNRLPSVRETIKCETLDETLTETQRKSVSFIKIDVEGHEINVLHGAIKTIDRVAPTIFIEIDRDAQPLEFLLKKGYQFYDLDLGDQGHWTTNVEALFEGIQLNGKHHDVLCWKGDPVQIPPSFLMPFHKTRFGK